MRVTIKNLNVNFFCFFMGKTTNQTSSIDNFNAILLEHNNKAVSLCTNSVNQVEKFLNQCSR